MRILSSAVAAMTAALIWGQPVFATEMAWEVIDHAMQCFGAMGMTKELPLHLMASSVRNMRIYDGPSEVHRMVVARNLMGTRR